MNDQRLLRSPVFWAGLLIRAVLVVLAVPVTQSEWFHPFIVSVLGQPSVDPWSAYLAAGGDSLAFPYGPVMLAVLSPLSLTGWLVGLPFGAEQMGAAFGIRATLLGVDLAMLAMLTRLKPDRAAMVRWCYWLNPVVLFTTYWHGQLDIIPLSLGILSFVFITWRRPGLAGAAIALAVSAKLSMLLILPFLAIYLVQNRRVRRFAPAFFGGFGGVVVLGVLLPVLSSGYREMVLNTPEADKVFWLGLPEYQGIRIYFTPLAYLFAVYLTWRLRRSNFRLITNMAAASFLIVVLMTPASPGWFLWAVPFVVLFQTETDRTGRLLAWAFYVAVALFLFVTTELPAAPLLGLETLGEPLLLTDHLRSLAMTLVTGLGMLLIYRTIRRGVREDDYFKLSRRPLAIGIAGDSGTGKDTLGEALVGLFGRDVVTHVCGDGYHRWGRGAPMWSTVTHLDPRANHLYQLASDVGTLIDGRAVTLTHYDHNHGRLTMPARVKSNDVIIASGLHTLLPPSLRDRLDVKIFLKPDEDLRRLWKLSRDSASRGHARQQATEVMNRRLADARRFIAPQEEHADIIFSVSPSNPLQLADAKAEDRIPLRLTFTLREAIGHERLTRLLIALCNIQLDVEIGEAGRSATVTVQGDVAAEDVALVARMLVPRLEDLLGVEPRWHANTLGIMQLVVLLRIGDSLQKRLQR